MRDGPLRVQPVAVGGDGSGADVIGAVNSVHARPFHTHVSLLAADAVPCPRRVPPNPTTWCAAGSATRFIRSRAGGDSAEVATCRQCPLPARSQVLWSAANINKPPSVGSATNPEMRPPVPAGSGIPTSRTSLHAWPVQVNVRMYAGCVQPECGMHTPGW